jgi:type IV pilus assembly protein PilW
MTRHTKTSQSGFTLVELMIAMVLGLIVAGGVVQIFVQGRQSYRVDQQVAGMQDEARFALDEMSRDLRMASFLGESLVPATVGQAPGLAVATDCGPAGQPNWVLGLSDAVTNEINTLSTVDNATGATANAGFSCINAAEVRANTDVVGVKRVLGDGTPLANLQDGTTYIRTNGAFGVMYTAPAFGAVPAPFVDREYAPRIYYIRNFSEVPGDGVPSLCRKVLAPGAPPSMTTECIARGIEDLQVEFGLDTDSNGTPNRYLANPTLAQLQQVVTVKLYLLARTQAIDIRQTDDRSYQVSNAPAYQPSDNFHRRLYAITVGVYNRRNLQRLLGI